MSERDTRRRAQKCCARGCSLRPRRSVRTAPAHCCFAARQRSPASWRDGCLPNFRRRSSPGTRCPVWPRCRSAGLRRVGRPSAQIASSLPRCRIPSVRSTATRSVIRSATGPSAAAGCCTPPPATVVMRRKRQTSRTARTPATTCWTSGAIGTSRLATGRRCCCRSRAVRGPSTVGDRRAIR